MEFTLTLLIAVASAAVGWIAARRAPRWRALLAAVGFALVAWPILCGVQPDRAYIIYPAFDYGELLFATAFVFPGVLAGAYADTPLRRILLGVLAAAVVYFVLAEPLWLVFQGEALRQLRGEVRDGVTLQTEFYTCVPSAMATVLRRWGIELSEGEAAARLHTTFQGTHVARLPRAVASLGRNRGLRAHIGTTDLDELAQRDRPAILLVRVGSLRHAVALLEMDARTVTLGDPLRGKIRISREEFEQGELWTGLAIWLDATPPGADAPTLNGPI